MRFPAYHCPRVLLILLLCLAATVESWAQEQNVIHLWYGKQQTFGRPGIVQRYVNVLGNVDPAKEIIKLDFSLNDGEFRPLTIGPDDRRIERPGDFNIEIEVEELQVGANTVAIEAVSKSGAIYKETIDLNWEPRATAPDTVIHWDQIQNLYDVAQPIDGLWRIEGDKVVSAPEASGYDRVLGIGDMGWTDYEVLFPMVIRNIHETSYDSTSSVGPALLLIMRWMGHTDSPAHCPQPHCGWEPCGSVASYAWLKDQKGDWDLSTKYDTGETFDFVEPELGKEYWVRYRVESKAGGHFYSFKIWDGGLQSEPMEWSRQDLADSVNMNSGSFIFVAHHIDLAIGTMQITPLANLRYELVDLLIEKTEIFVQLPYLALWAIGIIWALIYRRRDPKRGRWILLAFSLMLVTSFIGLVLMENLPNYLHTQGWITRRLTYVYLLINGIPICGHLLAWAILFKTLMPSKQKS